MDECPICFDACEHDATIAECCKKVYHRECLNKCPTCPTCRSTLPNQTFTIVIEGGVPETRVALSASEVEEADYFLRNGSDPRHEVRVIFPRMNCRLISACVVALIGFIIVFGMVGVMAFALIYKQGGTSGSRSPPPFSNNTLV